MNFFIFTICQSPFFLCGGEGGLLDETLIFTLFTMLRFSLFSLTLGGEAGAGLVDQLFLLFSLFSQFHFFFASGCARWLNCTDYFHSFRYLHFSEGRGGDGGSFTITISTLFLRKISASYHSFWS